MRGFFIFYIFTLSVLAALAQSDNKFWEKYELKGDSNYIFSSKTDVLNSVPLANQEKLKLVNEQTSQVYNIQSYNWYMVINYEMFKSVLFSE